MNAGTIYFDASCGLCRASVRRLGKPFAKRGYRFRPLQSREAQSALNLKPGELPDEVKLVTPDGRTLGGADTIVHLGRFVWWGRPVHWLGRIPGAMPPLRRLYRLIARNRRRIGGACGIGRKEGSCGAFYFRR